MFKLTKKQIIRNTIIFLITFTFLFTFDFLTKQFIFVKDSTKYNDYGWIGFRSFSNKSTTIFSFLNINLSSVWHNVIGVTILICVSMPILFSKNILTTIALSTLSAGVAGNVIDRAHYGYVRDVIFTPWQDKGTFNIADVVTIVGSGLFAISSVIQIFKK